MKIYIIRYYDEFSDCWRIDKGFKELKKAIEYINEKINEFPESEFQYSECNVE